MSKNELKVISIFKIIIRICQKVFEFCGETSKFLPKGNSIHYLNKEELIQQACLKKYIENAIFSFTSHNLLNWTVTPVIVYSHLERPSESFMNACWSNQN